MSDDFGLDFDSGDIAVDSSFEAAFDTTADVDIPVLETELGTTDEYGFLDVPDLDAAQSIDSEYGAGDVPILLNDGDMIEIDHGGYGAPEIDDSAILDPDEDSDELTPLLDDDGELHYPDASEMDMLTPEEDAPDVLEEVKEPNYQEIIDEINEYDFNGIDVLRDTENLDPVLDNFQDENWASLELDDQKEAIANLYDYINNELGLENPPSTVYYTNECPSDFGGFNHETNEILINTHNLHIADEAADTVAHELWHAYQHERAANPQSPQDWQYQHGLHPDNYIRHDIDPVGYNDQMVEAEARAFAEQIKDRLSQRVKGA